MKIRSLPLVLLALVIALTSSVSALAQRNPFMILHAFTGADGNLPTYVIQTRAGDVWGVTISGGGGSPGGGVLYKITAAGAYAIVHTFADKPDGAMPGKLIEAADGSIYGVTALGGTSSKGTIYRVDPAGSYSVLHSFNGTSDGATPNFLIQASNGLFYGTASFFGTPILNGTLFRFDSAGNFTMLHTFDRHVDGANPDGVVQANDGLLYGTCRQDGPFGSGLGQGTFWRSDLNGAVTLLHTFGPTLLDGDQPEEPLGVVQAADGFFYGAANHGGGAGEGAIFRIDVAGNLTVVHSFDDHAEDGSSPETNFNLGSDGFFYGTAAGGLPVDSSLRSGVVYRADTVGHIFVLHTFTLVDGSTPFAPAFLGTRKTVYATAEFGGPSTHGVTGSLALKQTMPVAALTFNPNPVTSGQSAVATVTLAKPAPQRGQVVQLFATSLLSVPASITVPAGQKTATFNVTSSRFDATIAQSVTAYIGGVGLSSPLTLLAAP